MGTILRLIIQQIIRLPGFRALLRFLIGVVAIPVFRFFLKRVVRLQDLDKELEKDLEQWFRGALLLLVATHNMEGALFGWLFDLLSDRTAADAIAQGAQLGAQAFDRTSFDLTKPLDGLLMAMRVMLAIGVTEAMPDQELFAVIYPGPPRLKFGLRTLWSDIRSQTLPFIRGMISRHLDRSTQVFAIMAAILLGTSGWVCYFMAITQYLIIGLVTSRTKALDVLERFDQEICLRRERLKDELAHLDQTESEVLRKEISE